jgi:arylsulfatase A-like enzyme
LKKLTVISLFVIMAAGFSLLVAGMPACSSSEEPPNILFIAVDDLNDWVGHLGGHPHVKTPNLDRLANQGVSFTRAYCSAPLCNPSRISLLTGVTPSRSGVYGNGEKLREKMPDAVTLMQYLKSYGYTTKGGGKIFHGISMGDSASWDYYFPIPKEARRQVRQRDEGLPKSAWAPWGPVPVTDDEMIDGKFANWAVSELEKSHDKPFFLACGFVKPHLPWYVPQKYFDMHPIEGIELPETIENDLDDVPGFGRKLAMEVWDPSGDRNFAVEGGDHNNVIANNQWHKAVQSYLATISFADAQVGKLLDALENSAYARNTIIVLWGDHGWHLGEKEHWRKHALWETTTRTSLIISAPEGMKKNQLCERPVSLIDIFPTLVEMCGLPERKGLDGMSLVPLLNDPRKQWERPVLTTYGYKNHAIRTEQWRFIQYNDGSEELYDHSSDPNEWRNLANEEEYGPVLEELRKYLPTANHK